VFAEGDRLPVAVGRDVPHGKNSHFSWPFAPVVSGAGSILYERYAVSLFGADGSRNSARPAYHIIPGIWKSPAQNRPKDELLHCVTN
jgi:hypothetical protein